MSLRTLGTLSAAFVAVLCIVVACSTSEPAKPRPVTIQPPSPTAEKPADYPGLHNVVTYAPGLYSGAAPEGDEGFQTLADMGVRTILSVDGSVPEVEEAAKYGIRYVHLPVTYSGIDEERRVEITRVVRDLPGPVYIHCHHGKHRSAGATAAASVELGWLDNQQAVERMKVSGTSANYTGMWACATDTRKLTDAEISRASNDFPSRWKTTGMVDSMVAIDFANDSLKAIEKAGWKVPADHPDLVPSAVAGNLENILRALEQDHETLAQPAEFHEMLKASADAAQALEDGVTSKATIEELTTRMKTLAQSCKTCHAKYRD